MYWGRVLVNCYVFYLVIKDLYKWVIRHPTGVIKTLVIEQRLVHSRLVGILSIF